MRHVIAHFHTYKNSGSSFDELLQANFGDAHIGFDGPFPFSFFNQQELIKVVNRHPDGVAFSSHQIRLPVPTSLDCKVLAAVFVRHPILRIRSIYGYAQKLSPELQDSEGKNQSHRVEALAIENSFEEWILALRAKKSVHHLSNAQTQIFAGVYGAAGLQRFQEKPSDSVHLISDFEQAKRNLAAVPLLARTEYYDEDTARFPDILATYGIDFELKALAPANVTTPYADLSVDDRVEKVLGELSEETRSWLIHANTQDLALYDYATGLLQLGTGSA